MANVTSRRVAGHRRPTVVAEDDDRIEPLTPVPATEPAPFAGTSTDVLDHPALTERSQAPEPDEPDEVEPPADATAAAEPPSGARRPVIGRLVLVLCLVAVLAACALAAVTTRSDQGDARAGDQALAAARTSVVPILSYDYRHLDADFAAASAQTTGSFRTDYQATTTKAVKDLATQTHAVVTAKVAAAGVVRSTANRATVLLFVDQTTTSNRLSSPKVDQDRVEVTMSKVDGHWRVAGLKAL